MVCLVHFDLEMCFAPQGRALFRQLNFQKCSGREVFFFTCKCASRHNGVQLFISHLARWLRTRRFSEPTFRPPEPQIIVKHRVSQLSYLFAHLDLRSSSLLSSPLLFSSLLFSFLLFSSLLLLFSSLPTSAFHLSILSEV